MATTFQFLKCPYCGKNTKLSNRATYKSGDPAKLAIIQTRLADGRRGFPKVDESNLTEMLDDPDYKRLADELVDMSSGILMATFDNNLPVHIPALLIKYQDLIDEVKKLKTQIVPGLNAEKTAHDLVSALTEVKRWKATAKFYKESAEKHALQVTLLKPKNTTLNERLTSSKEANEELSTRILTLEGEKVFLEKKIEDLKKDVTKLQNQLLLS